MIDKINFLFGVVGFVGSVISIIGAIKSTKESQNAKNYLKEITIKKTAIEFGSLKENLNKLYSEVNRLMLANKSTRGLRKEKQTYEEWLNILNKILLKSPEEFDGITSGLEEVRTIIKEHIQGTRGQVLCPK